MSLEQSVTALEQRNAELVSEVVRARDAVMGLSNMYTTITLGLAGTEDGQYFTVPGNGAYQKLYQHDGAQAPLIATYPNKSDLTDALTTLNTAVSDHVSDADPHTQYVDVAGVHAAFNQYGLGKSSPAVTDANNVITPGTFSASGVGALNFPGLTGFGILRVSGRFSGLFLQEAMYGGDQYYIRYTSDSGSTWTDWEQIYHTGMTPDFPNMPQVGGDPIVESGSNSNGEYTKFADGTLQMWSYKSLSSGETVPAGGFQPALGQASLEHTACVSSVGELLVLTEPRSGGYSYTEDMSSVVIGIDANNGRTNYRLYSVTGIRAGYTRGISFYAIGRWF